MCESHVNDTIRQHFNIKKVSSSHTKGITEIISESPLDENALIEAVGKTGYKVLECRLPPLFRKGLHKGRFIPEFCYPVLIGTVLLLTLISFLSVRQQLKGTAADALRPYSPKKMRKIFFERFRFWDKLHFGTKWNIRDLSRHKSRSAMTLFGIIGCMVLMVGGLGMRDTMSGFLDLLDKDISNYTTKVNLIDDADYKRSKALCEELDGDWESLSGISLDGDTVTLDIIHNPGSLLNVIDEDNNRLALSDEGVYLCLRLKDKAEIGDKIEFSPYGSKETYTVKVVGYNRSVMTESVTMTDALADRLGLDYSISSVYTDRKADEIKSNDLISGKQDKAQLMDTFNSFRTK